MNIHIKPYSILALILAVSFFHIASHKFYISQTEIRINPENNSVEVSMKIFPDDLDRALMEIYGRNPQLATELELDEADKWLENYFKDHFNISINERKLELTYLGKEAESNAIWCYLEAEFTSEPKMLHVKNSILTEIFKDQKNIVQVYYNEYNKGLILDAYKPSGNLVISK